MHLSHPHPGPLVIGHRGVRDVLPENTIAAFIYAADCGADMVEFDIRETKDEKLIVIHNAKLSGMLIKGATYKELCTLVPEEERPPLLTEVIALCLLRNLMMDAEIKVPGIEAKVVAAFTQIPRNRLIITSFKDSIIKAVRTLDPTLMTGLIVDVPRARNRTLLTANLLQRRNACGADALMLHRGYLRLRRSLMRTVRTEQIPLFVWTVNHRRSLKRWLAHDDITGIITDRPMVAAAIVHMLHHPHHAPATAHTL